MLISKRRRFLITSLILSLGFVVIQFFVDLNRFWAIGGLGVLTILLFAWSLKESLGQNMILVTLILPAMFTLGVGFFWFLLIGNVFARIPVAIFYGFGIYVLCLTMNIFSVSAVTRTIALIRAARGVGFVLTLVTSFLIFDLVLSLKYPIYVITPLVLLTSFPLFLQGLWVVDLDTKFKKDIFIQSLVSATIVAEVASMLHFWPVSVVTGSLFLTVMVYIILGLGQSKLEERLFPDTIREHFVVGFLVFAVILFTTHWGG